MRTSIHAGLLKWVGKKKNKNQFPFEFCKKKNREQQLQSIVSKHLFALNFSFCSSQFIFISSNFDRSICSHFNGLTSKHLKRYFTEMHGFDNRNSRQLNWGLINDFNRKSRICKTIENLENWMKWLKLSPRWACFSEMNDGWPSSLFFFSIW